jgi:hypothetical protein
VASDFFLQPTMKAITNAKPIAIPRFRDFLNFRFPDFTRGAMIGSVFCRRFAISSAFARRALSIGSAQIPAMGLRHQMKMVCQEHGSHRRHLVTAAGAPQQLQKCGDAFSTKIGGSIYLMQPDGPFLQFFENFAPQFPEKKMRNGPIQSKEKFCFTSIPERPERDQR